MKATKAGWSRNRGLVATAVAFQWFYNGANFVAFKIGGDAIEPLLLAAMRFTIAAVLILPLVVWRWRSSAVRTSELLSAGGLGVVMLVGGQALAIVGTHLLPAGVASVFGSAAPIFLILFSTVWLHTAVVGRELAGVGLGFAGLVLMALFSSASGGFSLPGAALTLAASASWAVGSLAATRLRLPADPAITLAVQLASAAVILDATAAVSGVVYKLHLTAVSPTAWAALGFLVLVSTLAGYAVFFAVNRDVSPTLANTFNYASPVVALILSYLLLGEPLALGKIAAAAVALGGVALMVSGRNQA